MISVLTALQFIILAVQIGSLIYCLKNGLNTYTTHYGISVWGVIPIMLIGGLIH